jgi:hypothetical protein
MGGPNESQTSRGPGRPPKNPQAQGGTPQAAVPRRCDTCQFGMHNPALQRRVCRRYPPIMTPGGFVFPIVEAGDWCGEHRLAPAKPVEGKA